MLCCSVDCMLAGRPANIQSTEQHNTYQLLYIYSIPPDDGLQICPKHVEVDWRNKLRINCVSSWFLLHREKYFIFHVDVENNLLSILKFSYMKFLTLIYCFRTGTYQQFAAPQIPNRNRSSRQRDKWVHTAYYLDTGSRGVHTSCVKVVYEMNMSV